MKVLNINFGIKMLYHPNEGQEEFFLTFPSKLCKVLPTTDRGTVGIVDKVLLNLRNLLDKVGIVFEAHSTRSAATSAGITAANILKAADWSSELVFTNLAIGWLLLERLSFAAVVTTNNHS